jgi:hypothetical protein
VHFLKVEREQYQQTEWPTNQEASVEFKKSIEAEGHIKKVALEPRVPNRVIYLRTETSPEKKAKLLAFLDKNSDVFVWSTSDLIGVSRDVIEHKLQVNPNVQPKKQKLRKMSQEKIEVVKLEVQRLLDAGFIKEVVYP